MGKYFTVDVKPTIAASLQHAGAFAAGDVLFDWTSFNIPKGSAKLCGVTVLVRPKGDAGPTPNNLAMSLIFGKSGSSIGDANSVAFLTATQTNDVIGSIEVAVADYIGPDSAVSTSCLSVASSGTHNSGSIVLNPNPTSGTNVGYDKYYVAGIANGAFDFSSINAIAEAGAAEAASTQVITMDGSSMDVREHFIADDVVHIGTSVGSPAADSLIGTIATADSTTQLTMDAVSATALVDGDILYNINPIRLVLHFEK